MDELQLGLLGTGAVIVVGVVLYNAYAGARARRRLPPRRPEESEFNNGPLAQDPLDEPPFIHPAPGLRPSGASGFEAREPVVGGAPTPTPAQGGEGARDAAAPAVPHEAPRRQAEADGPREPRLAPRAEQEAAARREPSLGGAPLAEAAPQEPASQEEALEHLTVASAATDDGENIADVEALLPPASAGLEQEAAASAAPLEPTLSQAATPTPPKPRSTAVIDRRIDCIVPLSLSQPVPAERILPLAVRFRRAGTKQVHVEGRRGESQWEALVAGGEYDALRVAVQLANRTGPLNELEFSEFVSGVNRLADAVEGLPSFPDMLEAVSMGRELDAFAAQCDAQLSVNVLSDGAPWSANYVQVVATQDGLLLSRDGTRFVKLDSNQVPVFMLAFDNTNFLRDDLSYKGGDMITLLLDVPAADEDILPFRLVCDYAHSLSQRIGGHIVDDQRRPLPQQALQAIEEQLLRVYGLLEAAGIPAGSPVARRLFSV